VPQGVSSLNRLNNIDFLTALGLKMVDVKKGVPSGLGVYDRNKGNVLCLIGCRR
jgi:hypothetical protein